MKVLIIEDEAPASRRLQKLITEIDPQIEVLEVLDSIEASVQWLGQHATPEVIFMDIQLADGVSFDIFEQVQIQTPVIFTTAYDNYSLKAFKVNSIDYLLKPINKTALTQSIEKYRQLKNQFSTSNYQQQIGNLLETLSLGATGQNNTNAYKNRFLVKLGDRLESVAESDIGYFQAKDKMVLLITQQNKKYPIDYSLDDLERLLHLAHFFRINRQFIVRIDAIQSIHTYFNGKLKVILTPEVQNQDIVISREKSTQFKQWLDL
ncbi:LytR/AlgR family response regulator transcription factor [Microscilla marina]|uniref:Two-component system response regulator n=1 Tax=Microscilla marina ATCC 23134 TaxID=313606 RepID=A1ZRZ3_MICM2|nr:LytTR family DNA-binding domain-containing protein [Microscilla marina]EAY26881.1 two-component system response regulator [Microscilla marina ATCC 23134]